MYFLLRDDDTCGITEIDDLEKCYNNIWDKIPVNLSITPFRIPGDFESVPSKFKSKKESFPLREKKDLVDFLKDKLKQGHINVALHGYNHTKINGIPEYCSENGLMEKTRHGKEYLETLFDCKINTFVPPFNAITLDGVNAVINNELNLVSVPSFLY